MKTIGCIVALATLLTLSACTTPQYNYQPTAHHISRPPLGTVSTANVGDEMVSQGIFTERDAIKLSQPLKFGGLITAYTLLPGYYLKTGEDSESSYYRPAGGRDSGQVQKAMLADPWESVRLTRDQKTISVVTVFHVRTSTRPDGVTETKYAVLTDDGFQQTLIYSGKVGDKIKIGYREFSNNAARPAFNNDVDYDLGQSKTIGYKGARIEVIEASNESITYKVVSNFNAATQ